MPNSLICYILIGLPGSGKSTLAQKIVEHNPCYRIVSTDHIRATLYGNASIQGPWPEIESVVFAQIQQALAANIPIIYDATNCKRSDRLDLMQKLPHSSGIYWVALHLTTPVEQCKQWNQQRDRQVDEVIIDAMAQSLRQNPPQQTEGFVTLVEIFPQDMGEIATLITRIDVPVLLATEQVQRLHAL